MIGKFYAVLFQYSPNGANDKAGAGASVAENRLYANRRDACAFVKARYDELLEKERISGYELDPDWAEKLTDEEMREMGYWFEKDFSKLAFEYENPAPGARREPAFSWTVVELSCV